MHRVFNTVLSKSLRQHSSRGMCCETSEGLKWEKEKLQVQLQYEMTLKRLEHEQNRRVERLGISRNTANSLTVGICVVIAASGAWLVSQMVTETKVNLVSLQREISNHGKNVQSLMSSGKYVKQSPPGQADTRK
ncbi:hypothetical protein ABBQ32_006562 [Trebouxia sp. C0010 RCD-2024]